MLVEPRHGLVATSAGPFGLPACLPALPVTFRILVSFLSFRSVCWLGPSHVFLFLAVLEILPGDLFSKNGPQIIRSLFLKVLCTHPCTYLPMQPGFSAWRSKQRLMRHPTNQRQCLSLSSALAQQQQLACAMIPSWLTMCVYLQ